MNCVWIPHPRAIETLRQEVISKNKYCGKKSFSLSLSLRIFWFLSLHFTQKCDNKSYNYYRYLETNESIIFFSSIIQFFDISDTLSEGFWRGSYLDPDKKARMCHECNNIKGTIFKLLHEWPFLFFSFASFSKAIYEFFAKDAG